MAEEQIWKGHSSQWKNAGSFVLTLAALGIAIWLHVTQPWGVWAYIVPIVLGGAALWKWLLVQSTGYELTTERFITTKGVLTKVTDTLELYRVLDLRVVQPFTLRLVGLENVHLVTSDATTEAIVVDFLPSKEKLVERLRKAVEDCRERKRVRTLDVVADETHHDSDGAPHA